MRDKHIVCPNCGAKLGAWKLVLVHSAMNGIWKYRCACGWESPSGRSQNSLQSIYYKMFPQNAGKRETP